MKECLLTPLGNRFGNIREAVLRKLGLKSEFYT
jgi:hypothetical protein